MRNYDPTITELPPYFSQEVNIYYDVIPIVDVVNNLTKKISLINKKRTIRILFKWFSLLSNAIDIMSY